MWFWVSWVRAPHRTPNWKENDFDVVLFLFSPMRRAALFALASSFLAVVVFDAGNAFSFLVFVIVAASNAFSFWLCGIRYRQCSSHFGFVELAAGNALLLSAVCGIRYRQCLLIFGFVVLAAGNAFSFFGVVAFGTGEGLLWYGICVPCSKQAPGVRDAFSEAFGAKKQAFPVQKGYSVRRTAFCGTRRIF